MYAGYLVLQKNNLIIDGCYDLPEIFLTHTLIHTLVFTVTYCVLPE